MQGTAGNISRPASGASADRFLITWKCLVLYACTATEQTAHYGGSSDLLSVYCFREAASRYGRLHTRACFVSLQRNMDMRDALRAEGSGPD